MIVNKGEADAVHASRHLLTCEQSDTKSTQLLVLAKAKGEEWVEDQVDRLNPVDLGLSPIEFNEARAALRCLVRC